MTDRARFGLPYRDRLLRLRLPPLLGLMIALTVSASILLTSADSSGFARRSVRPDGQPDGSTLLVNGWTITPAGQQVALTTPAGDGGNLPLAEALSPDGAYLVVLDGGAGTEALQLIDTATGVLLQTVPF